MADALPPETAKVQLENLKAFTVDLELSVRKEAKGYGTKAVDVAQLRQWLDDALASNTDAAMRPKQSSGTAPYLNGANSRAALGKLLERVKARVSELEAGLQPKENTRDWVLAQLAQAADGKVTVPATKGGATRVASLDEVKSWLGGSAWAGEKY